MIFFQWKYIVTEVQTGFKSWKIIFSFVIYYKLVSPSTDCVLRAGNDRLIEALVYGMVNNKAENFVTYSDAVLGF